EIDLRSVPVADRQLEAARRAVAEAKRPFDLLRGPVLRAQVLRLDQEERLLLVTMHHIVSDEWSTAIFRRELALLYGAFSLGQRSPLPELPVQYADYALWERGSLQEEALERGLGYWTRQLADAPPTLSLPTDRPRPTIQT